MMPKFNLFWVCIAHFAHAVTTPLIRTEGMGTRVKWLYIGLDIGLGSGVGLGLGLEAGEV